MIQHAETKDQPKHPFTRTFMPVCYVCRMPFKREEKMNVEHPRTADERFYHDRCVSK